MDRLGRHVTIFVSVGNRRKPVVVSLQSVAQEGSFSKTRKGPMNFS